MDSVLKYKKRPQLTPTTEPAGQPQQPSQGGGGKPAQMRPMPALPAPPSPQPFTPMQAPMPQQLATPQQQPPYPGGQPGAEGSPDIIALLKHLLTGAGGTNGGFGGY